MSRSEPTGDPAPFEPVPFEPARTQLQACWWLLPTLAVLFSDVLAPRVAVLAAVLAGAAWQVLWRRDVLDRLTPLAAVGLLGLVLLPALVDQWPTVEGATVTAATLVGVSVLLTEQLLRLRDQRLGGRPGPARAAGRGVGPRS